ncbi:hypothetical protein KIPB_009871 [Kipferlia bialata]|uniref:Uncharacterized protein n=1 Tax=Kipferlia bialata TaxID=797122 RepID=A0A9K3D2B8_9EUKA|nr:hypothetical protein KIPB_009871 [Kipferlia bialata]|eukprot:g9871.t1
MVSTALVDGYPQGETVEYNITWRPSAAFPLLGLETPADYGVPEMSPSVPKYHPLDSLTCGVLGSLGITSLAAVDQASGLYDFCYTNPRSREIDYSAITWRYQAPDGHPLSLFGSASDGTVMWDAEQEVTETTAPLPTSYGSRDNPIEFECQFDCTPSGKCRYRGQYCQALQLGSDPDSYSSGSADNAAYDRGFEFQQPEGVLCPSQEYAVSTQRALTKTWKTPVHSSVWDVGTAYYAGVYNSLVASRAVCEGNTTPTESEPVSLTILKSHTDTVTMIEFSNPGLAASTVSVVMLLGQMLGAHFIVKAILVKTVGRDELKKARGKEADIPSTVEDSLDTEGSGLEGAELQRLLP